MHALTTNARLLEDSRVSNSVNSSVLFLVALYGGIGDDCQKAPLNACRWYLTMLNGGWHQGKRVKSMGEVLRKAGLSSDAIDIMHCQLEKRVIARIRTLELGQIIARDRSHLTTTAA